MLRCFSCSFSRDCECCSDLEQLDDLLESVAVLKSASSFLDIYNSVSAVVACYDQYMSDDD